METFAELLQKTILFYTLLLFHTFCICMKSFTIPNHSIFIKYIINQFIIKTTLHIVAVLAYKLGN